MRPLTEEETKTLFQKLAEYMGRSVEHLINRSDERHCFRLIKVCVCVVIAFGDNTYLCYMYRIQLNPPLHFVYQRIEYTTSVNR